MASLKNAAQNVAAGTIGIVLFFGALECLVHVVYWVRNSFVSYVPLPYVVGHDYGPVPPWLDSQLILAPDKNLIWRQRTNLARRYVDIFRPIDTDTERLALFRRFSPWLPAGLNGSGSWNISLNAEGFRDQKVWGRKASSAFRIVCLGDSWTFGMNVDQKDTYPERLNAMLQAQFPNAKFEVLNRGVLAYSSYQGVELLRGEIHERDPDVVVIAYAMNDAKVAGYRDKDRAAQEKNLPLTEKIARLMRISETYKLWQFIVQILMHKPPPIGFYLKNAAESVKNDVPDFDKLEPWTRVGLRDYRDNIVEMIRLTRSRNAYPILLYNELWEDGLYLRVLKEISQVEQVPLIDGSAIIRQEKRRIAQQLESRLGLQISAIHNTDENKGKRGGEAESKEVDVIFRVYVGEYAVPRAMYIVGLQETLGGLVPNKVAMYDDGTHGDQRAGDSVWSYTAKLRRGAKVFYVYTNSGRESRWEGLDVPHIRSFELTMDDQQTKIYQPIETFGKIYAQADSWHTDAAGYDLITQAVLDAVKQGSKFRNYLRKHSSE